MQRFVVRMFADQWRQWLPTVGVVAVVATMIGLCVQQFAWTGDPAFRAAADAAGVGLAEFQIISVTIYAIIALVSGFSLTIVGRASVQATRREHALWLLLGATPSAVLASTLAVLAIVSACGAVLGATASSLLSFWVLPAFNTVFAPAVDLPRFTVSGWAAVATIVISVVTALIGGLLPARRAAHVPPSAALRSLGGADRRSSGRVWRIVGGLTFLLVAAGLVVAASAAKQLGSTSAAAMFNLAVDAGVCALIAVYLLCAEIVGSVLLVLHVLFARLRLVVSALGTRAAAARVQDSVTAIAPLAAGLGGIGLLLVAVESVVAVIRAVQPDARTSLTDVWTMVVVVAVAMLATSAAVVALSARGREREIALLQVAGLRERQVGVLLAAESFALALAASVVAGVPVVTGGLVAALVSKAALGTALVVWPVAQMLVGLVASWLVLFVILLVPALAPLRDGPGAHLREQEA